MNIIKKYRLMFEYIKSIKKNLPAIEKFFLENNSQFAYTITSIKIDNIYRVYTVINLKPYNIQNLQTYGHTYLDNEVSKFLSEFNKQLANIGLRELVGLAKADRIGENNILIVMEYKYTNIGKIFKNIIISILATITLLISYFLFLF